MDIGFTAQKYIWLGFLATGLAVLVNQYWAIAKAYFKSERS